MAGSSGRREPDSEVRFPVVSQVTIDTARGGRIVMRLFPESARLARDVERAASAAVVEAATDEDLLRALETRLRAWYPRLTIHARTEFAALEPDDPVWYVMRDGRIGTPDPRLDRMRDALADVREDTVETGETTADAREVAGVVIGPLGSRSPRTSDVEDQEPDS